VVSTGDCPCPYSQRKLLIECEPLHQVDERGFAAFENSLEVVELRCIPPISPLLLGNGHGVFVERDIGLVN